MTAKLTQHILLRVSHTHTIQCGNISTSVYRLPSRIWLYVTIYSVYVLGREIDDGRHREKLWLPRDRIIDNEACAERRSVTCLMCGWPKVQQDLPPVTHLYPEGNPFFFPHLSPIWWPNLFILILHTCPLYNRQKGVGALCRLRNGIHEQSWYSRVYLHTHRLNSIES